VDMVMQRLVLMDKYITAHRVLNELKEQGLVKFLSAIPGIPPNGFRWIDDKIATVYGPPVVKVTEAFDKSVTERLNALAADAGNTGCRT
jgi:hypothetical protein